MLPGISSDGLGSSPVNDTKRKHEKDELAASPPLLAATTLNTLSNADHFDHLKNQKVPICCRKKCLFPCVCAKPKQPMQQKVPWLAEGFQQRS